MIRMLMRTLNLPRNRITTVSYALQDRAVEFAVVHFGLFKIVMQISDQLSVIGFFDGISIGYQYIPKNPHRYISTPILVISIYKCSAVLAEFT